MADPQSSAPLQITIIGSLNVDLVSYTERIPNAGETLTSQSFMTGWGGKGANQAVATAKLARTSSKITEESPIPISIGVAMVGAVGNDDFGPSLLTAMNKHGVDTSHVKVIEGVRTGVAVIIVESSNGENRILINPGANGLVVPAFFASPSEFLHPRPSMIVMQLEIPLETVLHVCREAKQNSIPVLLNPAPAIPLPASIYEDIAILVVNETEASMLSGIDIGSSEGEVIQHAHEAAGYFLSKGCPNFIVTLGALGAIVHTQGAEANPLVAHIPAVPTKVVDTTAAGDTFIGAVAVAAAKGWAVDEPSRDPEMLFKAVKDAVTASSWTVARKGTWDAMPRTEDLE